MPRTWSFIGWLFLRKPGLGPINSREARMCAFNQNGRIGKWLPRCLTTKAANLPTSSPPAHGPSCFAVDIDLTTQLGGCRAEIEPLVAQ